MLHKRYMGNLNLPLNEGRTVLSSSFMQQVAHGSFEQHSSPPYLSLQVSFKGNLPCDVQEILETTADGKEN